MSKCTKCRNSLAESASFCSTCGTKNEAVKARKFTGNVDEVIDMVAAGYHPDKMAEAVVDPYCSYPDGPEPEPSTITTGAATPQHSRQARVEEPADQVPGAGEHVVADSPDAGAARRPPELNGVAG